MNRRPPSARDDEPRATRAERINTDRPRALLHRALIGLSLTLLFAGCVAQVPLAQEPRADPDITWGEPFDERFTVVLDPGHGGRDIGTRADNGLLEKTLTLDLARRIRARLETLPNVDVVMTRNDDHWLSRADRIARLQEANADVVLSLHFNHLPETHIALVETYYAHASNIVDSRERRREERTAQPVREPSDVSFTRGSKRLAELVQQHVFGAVDSAGANAVDGGVKRDTLFVLTRSLTSGALVELTCLSNPREAARLKDERYRDELADALVIALLEYRAGANVVASAGTVM